MEALRSKLVLSSLRLGNKQLTAYPKMQNWSSREDGDCLLSSGGNWPQTESNRLFVRPCYPALFHECQTLFQAHIQGAFLMGTPGIGKSCFLDYALHCFLQGEGERSVLYLSGPRNKAFIFRSDGSVEEHELAAALRANMADKVDVVLYDPHETADRTNDVHLSNFRGKPFIVALSPDEKNCKKLRKDTTARARLYMGTFSLQEAEDLRSSCYPHVPQEVLRTRYAAIGGIARHLIPRLLPSNVDMATREVEEKQSKALNIIAENPLLIDAGELASQFKSLWSLYHLQPCITAAGGIDYYDYTIEPCCDDARIRIRDMLMKKDVQDLWNMFEGTNERHGTLRGIRYEAYAHKKILAAGLHGNASSLTEDGIGKSSIQVSIPASLPRVYLPSNDLGAPFKNAVHGARQLPTGGYLLPESPNFPVIDSLFASADATFSLQMKAGRSKPLSGKPANSIYATAGGCLVFVVPDESIIRRKLAYSEAAGPSQWRHYRIVLKEL